MKEFILDGTTAGIFKHNDDNTELTISGWSHKWRNLEVGEVIMIASKTAPNDGSSYIVKSKWCPLEPKDQFFVDLQWISKAQIAEQEKLFSKIKKVFFQENT